MAEIARSDFRDAVLTLLAAQQAATPSLLRQTSRFNPGGMSGEKPIAWMGEITDELAYNSGTRHRTMSVDGQIATTFPADRPTDDFDDLIDALITRFTAAYNVIPNTVLRMTRAEPNEVSIPKGDGADIYKGVLCTWTLDIWENRI